MSRSGGSDGNNTSQGGSQRDNPFSKLAKNNQIDGALSIFRKMAEGIMEIIEQDRKRLDETYDFPAKIGQAYLHKKAIRFGWNPKMRGSKKKIICPCCEENIQTVKLDVEEENTTVYELTSKKFRLSSSVGLFFTFIKYLVIMLLLRFVTVDCFNLLSNLLGGDYCEKECSQQFWTFASILYKTNREDLILSTDVLSLVTILFLIAYFLAYRKFQYKMYEVIDIKNQTQDDFTIFVENIPVLNFPHIPKT